MDRSPLDCYVCAKELTSPRILPCLHSICSECSPCCSMASTSSPITVIPGAPDRLAEFLIETSHETAEVCANCDQTKQPMYYCETCQQALCHDCRSSTHKIDTGKISSLSTSVHVTGMPKDRTSSREGEKSKKELKSKMSDRKSKEKTKKEELKRKQSDRRVKDSRRDTEGSKRLANTQGLATTQGTAETTGEKKESTSDHDKKVNRLRKDKAERLDRAMALYAARAERGAKKGQARRKNYFQAMDQYQTTIIGGGTTIGGATAINEREDDDFAEKTVQEMKRFLADEKLVETKFEYGGKWDELFRIFKRKPYKSALDEYWRLEDVIGEDMMNVLSKTENIDGTTALKPKDVPTGKPPPMKRGDDPAYELQWM
ncbi:hypothetical protein GCK32_009698 [Trichostrongylus colubriformis]|uniref:B box-type domain-containing protein n=1 Tax=Trichostrongylus colubriformis TaxID=6319 RepID=A0AAN8FBW8_TRICO